MESIPTELYPTYTPLMLTIEGWSDEIFAHFDRDRITGAFVEGANGLRALRGRLLYGLCEDRSRRRTPAKEPGNGNSVDGPFLGIPLSRILPQEPSVNGEAPSTLES